jgi:uncharacterized membrane protein
LETFSIVKNGSRLVPVATACGVLRVWVSLKLKGRLSIGLVVGYWLLVISYWLLVIGYWLLVIADWLLVKQQTTNNQRPKQLR